MTYFVQYPTDGAGKKVRHHQTLDVRINTEISRPVIGSIVTGATSGFSGILSGLHYNGILEYYFAEYTGLPSIGEYLQVNSITVATVDSTPAIIYTQATVLADPDVPENRQKVDFRGAANVRFTEGEPQFDAFGRIEVSQMTAVGEYYHIAEDQPDKYWTKTVGSGAVTHNVNTSMIVYSCGTAAGSEAMRTTQFYHPYKPGTSQLCYFSTSIGDTGKENCVREWGYFDDNNGFGFRLTGTVFSVFLRTSTSGVVTETIVNQGDWSHYTLLSTVYSEFALNISKANIYWADMEWLGVGRVRLGVISPDGRRIVCHVFQNANKNSVTYMRSGTLPLRWRQYNTGITASSSEMSVSCGVVFSETSDVVYKGKLLHHSPANLIQFTDSDNYVPFLAFRPKLLVNGITNRIMGLHKIFEWYSQGDALHISLFKNPPSLTGAVWSSSIVPGSMLEVDESAYEITQGLRAIESFIVGADTSDRIDLGDRIENAFGLNADGVTQDVYVFAAKVLKTGGQGKLFFTKYWKEIR